MTDIDAIWRLLKSEDGGGSSLLSKPMKVKMSSKSKKKQQEQQLLTIKQRTTQQTAFNIDDPYAAVLSADSYQSQEYDETPLATAHDEDLRELAVEFASTLNYDSDDEEDEGSDTIISPNINQQQPPRTERLASALHSSDVASQIESLSKLNHIVNEHNDNTQILQTIMDTCGKSLFRLVSHKSSKCRRLSLECMQSFLRANNIDVASQLPYLISAIVARYPSCGYDKDMEIFIQSQQDHDFFRRGGATSRQDKNGLVSNTTVTLVEPHEELRLALCCTFKCLVGRVVEADAAGMLEPYYSEMILSLQTCLKDPFNDVKVAASSLLTRLLQIPRYELGAKYFALGLARAALPNCRHRNTTIIIAGLDLLEASITVNDKAKGKGAGSGAIIDLTGFRDPNAINIASFYDSEYAVSVNTLAELSSHRNYRVRLRCCKMIKSLLTNLPDRYEYEQRLLPYVMLFINDVAAEVQHEALACINNCGRQYERDHSDEIIERRQLGVDGDESIDYDVRLPKPFTSRPSLGARLFVRNNTSRFFGVVLGELSNWRAETRLRSAELLLVLAVFCEEHLTKDLHSTLNNFVKAIDIELTSRHEHGHLNILKRIEQVLCLMAKYVDPASYLTLLQSRILGSSPTPRSVLFILSSLIKGAPIQRLIPHWLDIFSLVSSPKCIGPFSGSQVRAEGLTALINLLNRVDGDNDEHVFLSHFENLKDDLNQALNSCACALEEVTDFGLLITFSSESYKEHTNDDSSNSYTNHPTSSHRSIIIVVPAPSKE